MNLVICMAGLNTRFHNVGFDVPKYLLPWESNTTIIHEILRQFVHQGTFEEVLLLANQRDKYFKKSLVSSIESLGLGEQNLLYIGDTCGQAETAYIGAQLLKNKDIPFLIHNGDTVVKGRNFKNISQLLTTNDAVIDVFVANNPAYSYVKVNGNRVREIVEKTPISPFASSGLYCFKSSNLYIENFDYLKDKNNTKEFYVSDLLTKLIVDERPVVIDDLDLTAETIVLGTPQEYGIELAKKNLKIYE